MDTSVLKRLHPSVTTLADQAVIAASNLAFTIAAFLAGGTDGLGRFSVVQVTANMAVVASRVVLSEPVMTHQLASSQWHIRRGWLLLGSVGGCGAALAASFTFEPKVAFVGLLAGFAAVSQDVMRLQLISQLRIQSAAASDSLLLVGAAAICVGSLGFDVGIAEVLAVWTASLVGAAALAFRLLPSSPGAKGSTLAWWRCRLAPTARTLVMDNAGILVTANLALLALGSLQGAGSVGLVRSVTTIASPIGVVVTAVTYYLLPRMSGEAALDGLRRRRLRLAVCAMHMVLLAAVALMGGLGSWLGRALFDGNGGAPADYLLIGVAVGLTGAAAPWAVYLRTASAYARISAIRLASSLLILLVILILTTLTASGYIVLVALQAVVLYVSTGMQYRSVSRAINTVRNFPSTGGPPL